MQNLIDKIITEWSNQIPSGIIDLQSEEHKIILLRVLNENIDNAMVIDEVMEKIYHNK
jgi:hypothetical protein